MQTTESIEELGLELQSLANEAFPSTPAKDFDRMLKGRFFQALHVRWQRKLEAPKPAESFKELYDRARIVEQHEKQYTAAAAARGETKHLEHSRRYRPPSDGTGAFPDKENRSSNAYNQERICFICKQPIVHTEVNMARKLQVVASTPLNLRTLDRTTMALLSRTEVKEM